MSPGRGRPPKYVEDPITKKPVVGLSKHKTHGFFYNTHWKTEKVKMHNFGTDKNAAIFAFRQWEQKRGKDPRTLLPLEEGEVRTVLDRNPDQLSFKVEWDKKQIGRRTRATARNIEIGYDVPESAIWAKARELILQDIVEARKKLNLPIEINGSVLPQKSLSLEKLGQIYFQRKRDSGITELHIKQSTAYWKEFIAIAGVNTVRDITIQSVDLYQQKIKERAKKKKWSGSSVNNRFSLVKSVFRGAVRYLQSQAEIDDTTNAGLYLNRLEGVKKSKSKPRLIPREDYRKLLDAETNPTYRALLLLGLNCGMKTANLTLVRKSHIDLGKGTLEMERPKTGVIRVAMLWSRTAKALLEMQQLVPNSTDYLFVNDNKPLTRPAIAGWFRRRRKALGISDKVKFEHLRDSAQTVPVELGSSNPTEIALLLGHLLPGQTNNYLSRRPSMTKAAVKAIEQYYFGKE